MIETKDFIRKNMPSARFLSNPTKYGDRWEFRISYEIEDVNKLQVLHNKYFDLDNPKIVKKENWFIRLLDKII